MQNITYSVLYKICDEFDLGEYIFDINKLSGGLLHELWSLKTDKNQFALKRLNPHKCNDLSHNLLDAEKSQQVAQQFYAKDISTVVALLSRENNYTYHHDDYEYLVFPWVDGIHHSVQNISLSMAKEVGQMLAAIHKANVSPVEFVKPAWRGYTKAFWQQFYFAEQSSSYWPEFNLQQLVLWSEVADYSLEKLQQELIVSHRDLDAKNLLWQKNKPVLLDWEYAGLINPSLDVFIVSLNLSEVTSGEINWQKFAAVQLGYETHMPPIKITEEIIFGYYGYCLDWLAYNLKRPADDVNALNEAKNTYVALETVTREFAKII